MILKRNERIVLRLKTVPLVLLGLAALLVIPLQADTLYNNDFGGVNSGDGFNVNAWEIDSFAVANSFSLGANSTVTGFDFAVWMFPADSLQSVDWAVVANDGGGASYPFNGTVVGGNTATSTVNMTETAIGVNSFGINVFDETVSGLNLSLTGGTNYWLVLQNAQTFNPGNSVFWDQSDGPSTAYQSGVGILPQGNVCNGLCTGSESFTIAGTSAVPEPSSLNIPALGLLGFMTIRRKRRAIN